MPEFVLDTDGAETEFNALDEFTQGYVEAAFWTSEGPDEDGGQIGDAGFADLAPEALASMLEDCKAFQEMAQVDLAAAYDMNPYGYEEANAGHDFWLTRNGHGAGFWDRGFGDLRTDTVGGRLSRDAKSFGSSDLYLGDDGKVYVS